MSEDTYEGMGEFHDLFMPDVWGGLRPALASAFADLDTTAIVLDVGAGTGIGTRSLARVTAAQIVAIEPSRIMRAVLLARVADDPDLVGRVSVLAGAAPDILDQVSGPIAGFVCAHMLGHLNASDRQGMFTRLAGLLAPEGTGVLTLPAGPDAEDQDEVREVMRIGRHEYVAIHRPPRDGAIPSTEYRVLDGDRVLRSHTFPSRWDPPTPEQLYAELAAAGLVLTAAGDRVGVVRHRGGLG